MIVLDTNVISELIKAARADSRVVSWLRGLREQPVTTVINKAELLAGIAMLPPGGRRSSLADAVVSALENLQVCLPFTADAPAVYAEIVSARVSSGRPIGTSDAFIAAIAVVHGAAVATRDVSGFETPGLRVIDPWQASP